MQCDVPVAEQRVLIQLRLAPLKQCLPIDSIDTSVLRVIMLKAAKGAPPRPTCLPTFLGLALTVALDSLVSRRHCNPYLSQMASR